MPQPAVPQPKKFVYLKSGWPDMRCHRITLLVAEADRAAAGRAATEKVCVPKIGLASCTVGVCIINAHTFIHQVGIRHQEEI